MFSVPLNPKLDQNQFSTFTHFLDKHKKYIFDVYFTCRIAPFDQDAMGDVFINDHNDIIENALIIQDYLGITISATFNNIYVRPSQQNLDLWIENFATLYERGIRSCTLPHAHWVASGQIQKRFPDLYIKNTILRKINTSAGVSKQIESGFNYINLDRDLMRDRDTLEKIKKIKGKHDVKIALLTNEGCVGSCPMMDEHYHFNCTRTTGPQYFNDPISRMSCPKWDIKEPSTPLKTANLPPWKDDWDELLQFVDVFKMHGRESIDQLWSSMNIIHNYSENREILYDEFNDYLQETHLEGNPIQVWRKTIKNCKFDCWDCNYCDKIYDRKSSTVVYTNIVQSVVDELISSVNYDNIFSIPGLTSNRVQNLIYGICKHAKSYLEIGSAMGATALAAGLNNIDVHCVDTWKSNIQPKNNNTKLPDNTREIFEKNTKNIKKLHIHQGDFLSVDIENIKNIDVLFYDGPHDENSVKDAVIRYSNVLSDDAVLIFDDANWTGTVSGANAGIDQSGLNKLYTKLLLNDVEDARMWWNGLYIVVVSKTL